MSANASALGFKLVVNDELTWGTPQALNGSFIRATGGSGKTAHQTTQSKEMTSYQITDIVQTGVQAGGGYNGELSYPGTADKEFSFFLRSIMGGAYVTNVLKVGATQVPLTFEEQYTDLAVPFYISYPGAYVNSLRIDVRTGDIINWSAGFTSKKGVVGAASVFTTPVAAGANPIMSPISSLQTLTWNALAVAGPTAFSVELKRTTIDFPQMLSPDPADLVPGSFEASGSFSCYVPSSLYLTDYLAFTERALKIKLGGVAAKSFEFLFNKVNLTDGGIEGGGQNQPFIQTYNFTAKADPTTTILQVTRVP